MSLPPPKAELNPVPDKPVPSPELVNPDPTRLVPVRPLRPVEDRPDGSPGPPSPEPPRPVPPKTVPLRGLLPKPLEMPGGMPTAPNLCWYLERLDAENSNRCCCNFINAYLWFLGATRFGHPL